MAEIRIIYSKKPNFPSTDNHPDAKRFIVEHPTRGTLFVDAIGDAPTIDEIDSVLNGQL